MKLMWLRRLMWPHGIRCLWFCPPWHSRVNLTVEEWRASDGDER